jgi:hypothetical protein
MQECYMAYISLLLYIYISWPIQEALLYNVIEMSARMLYGLHFFTPVYLHSYIFWLFQQTLSALCPQERHLRHINSVEEYYILGYNAM